MADEDSGTGPAHSPGARKGEEVAQNQDEAGREDTDTTDADRPAGTSTARDATGINPEAEEPIDPESPYLLPQ